MLMLLYYNAIAIAITMPSECYCYFISYAIRMLLLCYQNTIAIAHQNAIAIAIRNAIAIALYNAIPITMP